jgi:hypothetical protein
VAIGDVHGLSHALLAGLGLGLALAGVAMSIWSTSRVLAPRLTTAQTLASPGLAVLRKALVLDQDGVTNVLERPACEREIAASLARQAAAGRNRRRRGELEYQLRRVTTNASRAESDARRLLDLAHVWQIEADLKVAQRWTLGGGLIVIIGAVLFFLDSARRRDPAVAGT